MLEARYDAKADRMRLTLRPPLGEARSYWLTRRQWLGWLHALLALRPAEEEAACEPRGRAVAASGTGRARAPGKETAVQTLEAIRLRRAGKGVQMVFVTAEPTAEALTMALPPAGVRQIIEILEQQAERAGWDVAAALARLNAAVLARAAVGKASRPK